MAMTIEQILEYIQNLSLKDALIYLVSQGIFDFSKAGYEKIKKIIVDKQNEGKYAFVPNKEEALFLLQSKDNPQYKQAELLVPKYRYLDIIRTGLLIASYNKSIASNINVDKNRTRITQIKNEIGRRPGGGRLLKIVKFPTTEEFSTIMAYLYNLKINNYPPELLEDEFEELIDDWEKSSKFVKNIDNVEEVVIFCKRQAEQKNKRFFILGMYEKAISIVEEAMIELNKIDFFKNNSYTFKIIKSRESLDIAKIEIIICKDIFG